MPDPWYLSREFAKTQTIPSTTQFIYVGGCYSEGDGGDATYRKVTPEPSNPGKLQSLDGAWWEIVAEIGNIAQLGVSSTRTALQNTTAFQAAVDFFDTVYVPPGDWTINTVYLRGNSRIQNDGHVIGETSTRNDPFQVGLTFPGSGGLTAGIDFIAGDFSSTAWQNAAQAQAWVVVRLAPNNLGNGMVNQFGFDYAKIKLPQGASATGLQLDRKIRWGYTGNWQVCLIQDISESTGILPAKTTSIIPINTTGMAGLAVGEKVRIENQNGDDTPWGQISAADQPIPGAQSAYFEHGFVKAFDATSITLEDELKYTYDKYWVIVALNTDNVNIEGGTIDKIQIQCASNCYIRNIEFNLCSFFNAYRGLLSNGRGTALPSAPDRVIGVTNSRYVTIENSIATAAASPSDNGAVKYNGVQDLTIINVTSYNMTKTGALISSMAGLFGDFFAIPYSCWSDGVVILGGHLGTPFDGSGASNSVPNSCWLTGQRDLQIDGTSMSGSFRVSKSLDSKTNVDCGSMRFEECIGLDFTGKAGSAQLLTCSKITSTGLRLTGPGTSNALLWFNANCSGGTIIGYYGESSLSADNPVRVQDSGDIHFVGCRDNYVEGRTTSVSVAGNGIITHTGCVWHAPVAGNSNNNGTLTYKGSLHLNNNAWNQDLLQLANRSFWIDTTGHFRLAATGAPTGDTAGNVIPYLATGTNTPVGAITPHQAGEVFVDTINKRVWTAYGTTSADWAEAPRLVTGSGSPTGSVTPTRVGATYVDTTNGQVWVAYSLTNTGWLEASRLVTGSGNPTGSVTPTRVGATYVDTTNNRVWTAYGSTSADWAEAPRLLTGSGSPLNSISPTRVGSTYVDTANGRSYVAFGTSNTQWDQIPRILTGSKTFDWPAVPASGSSQTTVTVTGAAVGDAVQSVRMNAALPAGMYFGGGEVTAADTVTVTLVNPTSTALNPASGTLIVSIAK